MTERPTVICFGELLVDHLPDGPRPGGAPANVAYHLRRLGLDAIPVTAVGNDPEGSLLLDHLSRCGLPHTFVRIDPERPTGVVNVDVSSSGEPSYTIRSESAWDFIPLDDRLLEVASDAAGVVFGTLALRSESNRQTLDAILERTAGLVTLDVNFRPPWDSVDLVRSYAARAGLLKMNGSEFERIEATLSPDRPDASQSVEERMHGLRKALRVPMLCVTWGSKGASLLVGEKIYREPGTVVRTVDTVGSGDAFLAGLVARLLRNPDDPAGALSHSCRLGAYVASRPGGTPPYDPEIDLEDV